MAEHRERRHLPYPPDQIFDLVADVERYPEFLPWCEKLTVLSRERRGDEELLVAEMTVAFKVYRERFKTEVRLNRAARSISVAYLHGPFKHLSNEWRFEPGRGAPTKLSGGSAAEADGTLVDFYIAFEFKNRALQLLVGLLFEEAFRRLVGAFDARARALYGRRTLSQAEPALGRQGSSRKATP